MSIKKILPNEIDFVSPICLDPSIDKKQRQKMQSGMSSRINWIKTMIPNGLQILIITEEPKPVKIEYKWVGEILHSSLAVHGQVPKGLLEFIPIEFALEPVIGKNLLFINCMWILPPFWNTGVAKRLIQAFIKEAKKYNGACVLAYDNDNWFGTSIKYMPSSFFKRFGFTEVARDGTRVLLFLDFGANQKPSLLSPKQFTKEILNMIEVLILHNSQCPWSEYMVDQIKEKLDKNLNILIRTVKTDDRSKIIEFGLSRGVYINGVPVIKRMASWNEIKKELKHYIEL